MAKAPKSVSRETSTVSQETIVETTMMPPVDALTAFLDASAEVQNAKCSNCLSWRPEVGIPFGGCAKSGLTTTHYGETRYVHYTPDGASCSAFEAKE